MPHSGSLSFLCLSSKHIMILGYIGCILIKPKYITLVHLNGCTVFILYLYWSGQVYLMLHDRTTAGGGIVISVHFKLISIHIVKIRLSFPPVVHFGYGNELDRLPLL